MKACNRNRHKTMRNTTKWGLTMACNIWLGGKCNKISKIWGARIESVTFKKVKYKKNGLKKL